MAELLPTVRQRFFDANGAPLAGGLLYTYAAGTTTPQATYTDQSGASANTNPIVLNANGEADVWIGGFSYKIVLQDANGVVQWTEDNVSAPGVSVSQITFTHGLLDLAALKAVTAANRSEGLSVFVESVSAFFYFSASSVATGDDVTVVTPSAGTGRWIRVGTTAAVITDFEDLSEQGSNPATPAAGYRRFFAKATGLFWKNSSGTASQLATIDQSETLTNKTIDAASNTLSNLADANIKSAAAIARSKIAAGTIAQVVYNDGATGLLSSEAQLAKSRGGTGIDNSSVTFPSTGVVVTEAASETLTNKTIAAGSNTVTGLTNTNLSGSAGVTNGNLAQMSSNTVKGNVSGSLATPSDLTPSQLASILLQAQYTTTATATGTTTLTATSTRKQFFTGTLTQTIVMPVVSTLVNGQSFEIVNLSSNILTTQTSGGNSIQSMAAQSMLIVTCIDITAGTGLASWSWQYFPVLDALLPVANGGTGLSSITAHGMIVGNGTSAPTVIAPDASTTKVWTSGGLSADPSWQSVSAGGSATAPTVQKFTSTGTTTGYLFTCSSANATVGATYTNNGQTFTVLATIASSTKLFTSGASAPTASGTLTKSGGTGDATITFSAATAIATYTTPISPAPLYIRVRMVGAGGGGGGSGTGSSGGTGGTGGNTVFGTALLVANGGVGGTGSATSQTAGGTASLGTGPVGIALTGGTGGGGNTATASGPGGMGAPSALGGGGGQAMGSGTGGLVGSVGLTNTGGGGGGASGGSTAGSAGAGGGSGGFVDAIITSPSATYAYAVGAAGTAGTAGTSGVAGGAGGSGLVTVEEFYQ